MSRRVQVQVTRPKSSLREYKNYVIRYGGYHCSSKQVFELNSPTDQHPKFIYLFILNVFI